MISGGRRPAWRRRQLGLTLIEMMVAITIGLILLAGVIQIFSSNKQTYRVQDATSRLQENGRFALQLMANDIRMADFWGCQGGSFSNMTNNLNPGGGVNFSGGGIDGTAAPTLILRGGYGPGITVQPPYMPTPAAALHVTSGAGVSAGDILLVSNCSQGDLFQATNVSTLGSDTTIVHNPGGGSPGNATGNLSASYQGNASLYKAREIVYSNKTGARGQLSLFRSENGVDQEMVEGVENMQVLYGEDTDGDRTANRYVPAGTPGLVMDNVMSVRVSLTLLTMEANVSLDTTAAGRRIRQTYTATVTLRNRAK